MGVTAVPHTAACTQQHHNPLEELEQKEFIQQTIQSIETLLLKIQQNRKVSVIR